jgi:hypothetical protein
MKWKNWQRSRESRPYASLNIGSGTHEITAIANVDGFSVRIRSVMVVEMYPQNAVVDLEGNKEACEKWLQQLAAVINVETNL